MQYVWNLVSWFRCSTSVPPVNPGDAPTEPPKESKTLTGWKAWAAGTKRKEIPEEAKAVIAAIEEAKAAAVEEAKPETAAEASTTAPAEEATKAPVVEEAKPEPVAESAPTVEESAVVPTALDTIPEETKELVSEDKKKVEEKGADEAKDLGSEFTSSS